MLAALAMTCTHAGDLAGARGAPPPTRATADAGIPGDVNGTAATGPWAGECPVAVEHAAVEVARVAGASLTVCDVAVRAWQRTRAGLAPLDARALVEQLVAEEGAAALAREGMPAGGWHDRAVAAALADGLLRAEARARVTVPDEAAVARWYAAHADDFQRPARVRARWAILRTEAAARAAIAALAGGGAFEDVVARSVDPLRARDHGDLGELRLDDPPAAVGRAAVEAAFALTEDGAVSPRPVRVAVTTTVRVRGRARARRLAGWAVVQRLGRSGPEVAPLAAVRRRVLHRMMRERYEEARVAAGARWEERLRAQVAAGVDAAALATVRVAPP